jgi:DNA topoisomerase-2
MQEEVQKLSHLEHILKRPDSYVGPVEPSTELYWILSPDKEHFTKELISYPPALLKVFDEILVNAIDRHSLHPKDVTAISVHVDKEEGSITVTNNGPLGGLTVKYNDKCEAWNPELVFGHLLTSTNYDDTTKRIVGGRNGYGAKLANIYSTKFEIEIKDGVEHKVYTQSWSDNMTVCQEAKIKKHAANSSQVTIKFTPDWSKFRMVKMNDYVFKIFEKRVWDCNVCTGQNCKVKFQGEPLPKSSFEKYAKMHEGVTEVTTLNSDRWSVCIGPSQDGFQQVSFVNGICTTKGGTHVDHVASVIAAGIIDDMAKKLKLKPQQVKNAFTLFVKATIENPTFSSQVKSECTSKAQDFGSKFEITSKSFIKNALKTGIQDELAAYSKYKELQQLKKTDGGARKSRITGIPKLDDANWAGTAKSSKCTLIITEGDSAKTLAVAGLSVVGRDSYGVFPLRGKCKNVRDASVNMLTANQEFNDLKKILGLQQGKIYENTNDLRYGRLMIMTDADHDGSHIKGLILNMFHYFWPSLLKLNFVVSMVTPIIKATKGKDAMSFYTESAFRTWYGQGKAAWKIKYYKGLGTSTSAEAREYFKEIEKLTVMFDADIMTDKSIVLAFDKKKADDRKSWLLENTVKEKSELEVPYGNINTLSIGDFVHKDLVNFSLADLKRSIAHVADGFKPSQRKVLYACFMKNLKDEMKVAQLAAYVSEKTAYHHGEVSLAETIVKLANDFVGSNNINLLVPCGQFGTRLMGGKDASQTRYIFTKLATEARKLFHSADDPVLTYVDDDGKLVEPEYFVPVLPTVLINGTEGIGTGYSSFIPPFDPEDIKENITKILKGLETKEMKPFYRGFKGTMTKSDLTNAWVAEGIYRKWPKKITITELPPGRWTQDFREMLDTMVEKKIISSYVNNSTTDEVKFDIEGYEGDDVVKDFKLSKSIHLTNMHLFHPTKGIHKYHSPEQILRDFVAIRADYYKKRKTHDLQQHEKKLRICTHKAAFVHMVIEGKLKVFKRSRKDLEKEMIHHFPMVDGKFDYLLDIKTWQYTAEAVDDLMKDAEKSKAEYERLQKMSHVDLWIRDINNL